jgi:hypothetical protein
MITFDMTAGHELLTASKTGMSRVYDFIAKEFCMTAFHEFDPGRLVNCHISDAIGMKIDYIPGWEPVPGVSKIGGLPNLPDDIDWPRYQGEPMLFLAQIDIAFVAPFDNKRLLPPSGLLYFFLKDRMTDFRSPESQRMSGVLYNDASPPYPKARRLLDLETQYEPRPIRFNRLFSTELGEDHKLLGQLDGIDDWFLLLQLDRIWDNTIHDGPYGKLYFWISRADLSCRNFDNVRIFFQDDGL